MAPADPKSGDLWSQFTNALGGGPTAEQASSNPQPPAQKPPQTMPRTHEFQASADVISAGDDAEDEDLSGGATGTGPGSDSGPIEDEVAALFGEMEAGGSAPQLSDETRKMVFKAKPGQRDVNRVISVLVRALVNNREVTAKDLEAVLEITKNKVIEVIHAQAIIAYMVEEKGFEIKHASFAPGAGGGSPASEKRLKETSKRLKGTVCPVRTGILSDVAKSGKSKVILDASSSARDDARGLKELLGFDIHSLLIVPFHHEGVTYGMVEAINKDPSSGEQFFSQRDVEAAEEVAEYSAKVIHMARNPHQKWSQDDVAKYVARLAGCDHADLREEDVDKSTVEIIGERTIRQLRILPLEKMTVMKVRVAMDDPLDVTRRDAFHTATGFEIGGIVVTSRERISAVIDRFFGPHGIISTGASASAAAPARMPGPVTFATQAGLAASFLAGPKTPAAAPAAAPAAPAVPEQKGPIVFASLSGPKPTAGGAARAPTAGPALASLGEAFLAELEKKRKEEEDDRKARAAASGIDISGATADSAPVIGLVNKILEDAYVRGASDIHVDPFEYEVIVRYRVDGVLEERLRMPAAGMRAMAARVKVMSGLNISEQRLPQDGRIRFKEYTQHGFDFDLRVATAPMAWGEKLVFRILDKKSTAVGIEKMGYNPVNLEKYKRCLAAPLGMILHCGPTGSGKTTTLYAALSFLNTPDMNIMTAEDPVEFMLPGINQLQCNPKIGLNFARALKAYLRQDPDIILIGEIRDLETAEIAIEAALTGHQLFSTLHTNDAAGTVTRFVEMGVEPFLISSAVLCVCAQRLVRKLCPECRIPHQPTAVELEQILQGATDEQKANPPQVFTVKEGGCPKCSSGGFKGRMGVHEMLVMDRDLRELTARHGVSGVEIDKLARAHGMISLADDAMWKVRDGITSLAEALRSVSVEKI